MAAEVLEAKVQLWEYRVVSQSDVAIDNQSKLNRLGEDGWELVAVASLRAGDVPAAYLKRPRRAGEAVGTRDMGLGIRSG